MRKEKVIKSVAQEVDPKAKKHKKGEEVAQAFDVIEEVDIEDKIRLIFELYKEDKLLMKMDGFNSQVINFIFEGFPYISEAKGKKGEGNKFTNFK